MAPPESGAMLGFLLRSGREVQDADRLPGPPVRGRGGDDRPIGTVQGGLRRVLAVRRGPTLVSRSKAASDPEAARRLWTLSEELTDVTTVNHDEHRLKA
ncbi:hypothetical protein [Streptomyces acidicola]|uniref:hypothetical protein n=1 Tax=Streptomyces acidicola TaxID=2596892 RepID=UPI003413E4CC